MTRKEFETKSFEDLIWDNPGKKKIRRETK